jgi:hypothetical protein
MKKFLAVFSTTVILLFVLALFGWMVNQIGTKGKKFGFLTEPIKFMYSFPDLFKQSVEEVNSLPKTFILTPNDFSPVNELEKDLLVLSSYSENDSTIGIAVRNLRNDSIIKKWSVKNKHGETERVFHPLYLPDGSIVYSIGYMWDGLRRVDPSGNIIWIQDSLLFHHGMELNKDGDIWACTKELGGWNNGMLKIENKQYYYLDYSITKLDSETGQILFHKSVSEMLKEHGLENHIFKSHGLADPLHLNDVQPATKTTEYYQEDDVFISLRTISCILHYRPSTNEVINVIEGPFVSQHDVDIIDDHSLLLFNNNFYPGGFEGTQAPDIESKMVDVGSFYSSIVKYDLSSGEFSFVGDSIFKANSIFTKSEGLQEVLDEETYLVEEQNSGILWVIRNDEVIYRNVFRSQHEGHHHLPNWTRVIKYE